MINAYFALIILLGVFAYFSSFLGDIINNITLIQFSKFGLGLSFLTYSLTILLLLRADDEQ